MEVENTNYTVKIIILLAALFSIIAISTTVSASGYWTTLDGDFITDDGYITSATKYENANLVNTNGKQGYVEFNISSIPPEAHVLGVTLSLYVYYSGGWYGLNSNCAVRGINDVRPNTSSGAEIYASAKTGFRSGYPPMPWNVPYDMVINGSSWNLLDPSQFLEDRISNGWIAFIIKNPNEGTFKIAARNYSTYPEPRLTVHYEVTAPQLSNETPADYSTEVDLNSTLCIDILHDNGNTMNITWYWYNASNASYDLFASNTTVGNGTYCQNANWATEPCTEYTWWVNVEDVNGNFTNAVYTFTTHCVNPPSALSCSSPTFDSINISFTKKPANNGTTYTVMQYAHGGFPPSWTGGTFGENTTNSSVNITGIDEGQCYAFSFWTVWQSAAGSWHRSTDANQIICCASGGDYRICLFDEETEQTLDFSTYPYNLSTFVLRTHYYDNTEDDSFLFGDNASNPVAGGIELYDCGGDTCFNTSAVNDVWYFELICFYDFNNSGLYGGLSGRNPYSRKLTPQVALEIDCGGNTMDTIYFYVANRTIYYANYYYEINGNISLTHDSDFPESIVEYEYYFVDETGDYLSEPINTVFVSIYEPTLEGTKIIHQEYIDASRVINPFLIYSKDYLMGIYSLNNNVPNIGIAPTSTNLQPRITITGYADEKYVFGTVNISVLRQGDGTWIYISYFDSDYATENVTFMLYDSNDVFITSVIKYSSDTYKNFTGLSNATAYYIVVHVNKTFEINNVDVIFYAISSYFISDLIEFITTAAQIDGIITGAVGACPIGDSWTFLMVIGFCLVTLLATIPFTGPGGSFIFSGSMANVFFVLISGLSHIIGVIGIFLISLGFIAVITERRRLR